ncbi:hypothetical protein KO465_04695 [Candidatus Micrarchaeota archaeon]|nr:hypothetical protein [Candidatus Micrarchaeota archaeon]
MAYLGRIFETADEVVTIPNPLILPSITIPSGGQITVESGGSIVSPNPSGGVDYYVCGNSGDDANDGFSWSTAFKTLATALAASHANIASGSTGWAARNRIFAKGDAFEEDLVLQSQKTDIIGVGSYNQWMKPGLVGNHVPIGSTGIGVRWFNWHFRPPAEGGDLFTLDSTQRGIEYWDCTFDATNTVAAGGAIIATAVWFLKIIRCSFVGAFSDAVIEIGAGNAQGLTILQNYIEGANAGIELNASTTCSPNKILIDGNRIHTATECINDAASVAVISNNSCVTLQPKGTNGAGAIVGNTYLSVGNKISASNLANADWPALGSL